jgi:COP9 signalosome complex subunit 8
MDVSAVHAALAEKSYSTVAPLCDDLLLQVPVAPIHRAGFSTPGHSPLSHATLDFYSQTAARGVATDDWLYAIHLLAHLYLNDLYVIRCTLFPRQFFPCVLGG